MSSFCEIANFLELELGFSRAETERICNESGLISLAMGKPMIDIRVLDDALKNRFKDYDGFSMVDFVNQKFSVMQVKQLELLMGVTQ